MEIVPATPSEIAEFKQAAAARYAEKGVAPEVADQLFNAQMAKIAAEMQLVPQVPQEAPAAPAPAPQNPRIEKLASALAAELGRTRKQVK